MFQFQAKLLTADSAQKRKMEAAFEAKVKEWVDLLVQAAPGITVKRDTTIGGRSIFFFYQAGAARARVLFSMEMTGVFEISIEPIGRFKQLFNLLIKTLMQVGVKKEFSYGNRWNGWYKIKLGLGANPVEAMRKEILGLLKRHYPKATVLMKNGFDDTISFKAKTTDGFYLVSIEGWSAKLELENPKDNEDDSDWTHRIPAQVLEEFDELCILRGFKNLSDPMNWES